METSKREHEWVFEHLAAFMDGELDEEDTPDAATHLAECEMCQRRLRELRGVEAAHAGGSDRGVPEAYHEALVEELRTAPGPRRYNLVTVSELADLIEFCSEQVPVLSLYLDVTPPERQNRKYLAKFKRLVHEAIERLDSVQRQRMPAIQDEVEGLRNWLEYEYDRMIGVGTGWPSSPAAGTVCGAPTTAGGCARPVRRRRPPLHSPAGGLGQRARAVRRRAAGGQTDRTPVRGLYGRDRGICRTTGRGRAAAQGRRLVGGKVPAPSRRTRPLACQERRLAEHSRIGALLRY